MKTRKKKLFTHYASTSNGKIKLKAVILLFVCFVFHPQTIQMTSNRVHRGYYTYTSLELHISVMGMNIDATERMSDERGQRLNALTAV